jgi:hypothetical protein
MYLPCSVFADSVLGLFFAMAAQTQFLNETEAKLIWLTTSRICFRIRVVKENFTPSQNFSKVSIRSRKSGEVFRLSNFISSFDPKFLSATSDNSNVDQAIHKVLPLLNEPPKLQGNLEKTTFPIIMNRLIIPLSHSVAVEKKYRKIVKGENMLSYSFLGIGTSETLHGSPDARVRGFTMEDLDVISIPHDTSGSESDGGTIAVDSKKQLTYRSTGTIHPGHLSQLVATNITASFTEHNLHPDLNSLIPTMMINTETVIVSLYDSVKDIWMISDPILLHDKQQHVFTKSTILFIWLFVNHRLFLSPLPSLEMPKATVLNRLNFDNKLDTFKALSVKNREWLTTNQPVISSDEEDVSIRHFEPLPVPKRRKANPK